MKLKARRPKRTEKRWKQQAIQRGTNMRAFKEEPLQTATWKTLERPIRNRTKDENHLTIAQARQEPQTIKIRDTHDKNPRKYCPKETKALNQEKPQ